MTSNPVAALATVSEHFRRPRSATGTLSSRIFASSARSVPNPPVRRVLFCFWNVDTIVSPQSNAYFDHGSKPGILMWYNMCERLLDLSIIAFKPFNFREITIFRSLAARQPTWKLVDGLKSLFQSLHPDPSPNVHMRSYLTISLREEPLVTRSWARLPIRTICGFLLWAEVQSNTLQRYR